MATVIVPCEKLVRRLMTLASVHAVEIARGGQYAEEFQGILYALNFIGNAKVDAYGDFRLQDIRSWDRETWGAYWDIQRKFGRLENQLKLISEKANVDDTGTAGTIDGILETLQDQAVYCVRMMQIILRLEEKGLIPNARTDNRNV